MRIAFTSCICTQVFPDQPVWDRIRELAPDYLLLLGDLIYLDAWAHPHPSALDVDEFGRKAHGLYLQLMRQQQLLRLVRSLPEQRVFATWDDHDFLWNDMDGAEVARQPDQADKIGCSTACFEVFRRALSRRLLDGIFPSNYDHPVFWQRPQPPLSTPSVRLGPDLMLHLCDVRTFRTARNRIPLERRALLGAAQRATIAQAVAAAPDGTIHLLASATTLGDWTHYPADMEWLRRLGARHRILVLSGDIHDNATARIDTAGHAIHELTASGAAVRQLISVGETRQNFGLLDVGIDASTARFFTFGRPQPWLEFTLDHDSWERRPAPRPGPAPVPAHA